MPLSLPVAADKPTAVSATQDYINELGLHIGPSDLEKPWGAYFYIDPADIDRFRELYFPDFPQDQVEQFGTMLQPKILLVEPGKRLSWQYHNRRAELWKVVAGPVGVVTGPDDTEGETKAVEAGETVHFGALTRHRLCGLQDWGVVAEIWQHTDPTNPSDESDIVRVADDFNR